MHQENLISQLNQFFKKTPVNKFDENLNLINKDWINKMVEICLNILTTTDEGDILAFITGGGDGADISTLLKKELKR